MRMQYTDEEWRAFINDQKASGLTITKYCREHDLSDTTFHKKKKMIESEDHELMPIIFEKIGVPEQRVSLIIDGHTVECTADVLRQLVGCLK